jgi:predicted component of type VI protein secretion system
MKVQLIVVQGKPEGKTIPLQGPVFKIGRGETCNLRPNSEQVSREHSEFIVTADKVIVRDLGSRNGTLVNGKPLTQPCTLKDRDLIQVGPLTFAISIEGAPAPTIAPTPAVAKPTKGAAMSSAIDDISNADIESWLVADENSPTPERPSGVYGGDTQTLSAYRDSSTPKPAPAPAPTPAPGPDAEPEPTATIDEEDTKDEVETLSDDDSTEEFVDEANPFYVPKKKPEAPVKRTSKDSSDAASDILRKMMERRRSSH